MDERSAMAIMSGARRDWPACALRALCHAAAWGYGAATWLRNVAYERGWLTSHRMSVPVISVGNITTGGTGKTPVVAWVVQELQRRGYRPGILSRGYRSLNGEQNDEALVLERSCPGVPHVQNRDRVAGAKLAIEQHGCDVLVLDDGFQHRRLQRDLDILLIDALRPWGFGHLLPRGLLRESLQGLWRADLVLITRTEPGDTLADFPEIRAQLRRHRGTDAVSLIRFTPSRWFSAAGESWPLSALQPSRRAGFCGIGNPDGFWALLAGEQELLGRQVFPDHHHYSATDLDRLEEWRQAVGAEFLVTTMKDLVKIPAGHPASRQIRALDIETSWIAGSSGVHAALNSLCPDRRRQQLVA